MIYEICKKYTSLKDNQISLIKRILDLLDFASSISGQDVVLFVENAHDAYKNKYLVLYQAENEFQYKFIHKRDVSLWNELFKSNQVVVGKKEIDDGEMQNVVIFPIIDNAGLTIAGIRFLNNKYLDSYYLLAETAQMAIAVPDLENIDLYKPISYQDGLIIFAEDGKIIYANDSAKTLGKLLGLQGNLLNTSIYASAMKLSQVKKALQSKNVFVTETNYDGLTLEQFIVPIIKGGKIKRAVLLLKDKTLLKEAEKNMLVKNSIIKEIHHRVKNNLQMVSSLLKLQLRRSDNPEVKEALSSSIARIESISVIHELFCTFDAESIALEEIYNNLIYNLRHTVEIKDINMLYRGENIIVEAEDASYISIILNEIITNSIKHGFANRTSGNIVLDAQKIGKLIDIKISDNGNGINKNFSIEENSNLGLKIIKTLVENQLSGTLDIYCNKDKGMTVHLTFSGGYHESIGY